MSRGRDAERGVVLLVAVLAVIAIVSLSVSMMGTSLATTKEYESSGRRIRLGYLAEAGISRALLDLETGGTGNLGTPEDPVPFGAGAFRTVTVANANGTLTITSHGILGESAKSLSAVVRSAEGIFHHAMFAGNASGDPTYSLTLGGSGASADTVNGNLYVGGDVVVEGDASVAGDLRARGAIQGATGDEGVWQPIPDISAADYATNHDVDVAGEFASAGSQVSSPWGGTATQVPESCASHVFRMNPSDRADECSLTAKDDYFLEDPYEPAQSNGRITLSGTGAEPGPDGNRRVYFIDGNLWIHSGPASSYAFASGGSEGVQVTFVVRGNIYLCDDLLLENPIVDGVALIAIGDEGVADSGNIYLGDPAYGTLGQMNAFLYAENDFHDNNFTGAGGGGVVVDGIMSAGNHISIQRDNGTTRTALTLNFDDRVLNGTLALPGVSSLEPASTPENYVVVSVMEVAAGE